MIQPARRRINLNELPPPAGACYRRSRRAPNGRVPNGPGVALPSAHGSGGIHMDATDVPKLAALLVGSYVIGSISPAYILGRALKGIDLRDVGSRNLGARNAARTLGRPVGVLVWLMDMAKGATAVIVCAGLGASLPLTVACGAAAVAGHNWPILHGFRGGRGASTVMGATFALLPPEMAAGLALWVVVSRFSKSLYLGGLIAYPATTGLALLLGRTGVRAWSPLLIALPLMLRHVPAVAEQIRNRRLRLP
jgi:glycerol-3-phosphate acyltransferase PlsY